MEKLDNNIYNNSINHHSWTTEKTINLIESRVKFNHLFTGGQRSSSAWNTIAKDLSVGSNLCQKKWNNLSQKYKALKTPRTGISTEDGEEDTTITWPFYIYMDKFFSERHTINPPKIFDSTSTNVNDIKLEKLYENANRKRSTGSASFNNTAIDTDGIDDDDDIIECVDKENIPTTQKRGPYKKQKKENLDDEIIKFLKKENERGDRVVQLLETLINKY